VILKSILSLLSTPCEKLASLLIFSPAFLRGRQESTRRNVVKPSKRVREVHIQWEQAVIYQQPARILLRAGGIAF
jgi:hypothetical protein